MKKRILSQIIETKIVIVVMLLIAFYLAWYNEIKPVSAVLQTVIAFILPGWLFIDLLFPIDKIEIEVRVIIGLILSAVVSAVIYFVADQFTLAWDPIHIISGLVFFLAFVEALRWRTPPKEHVSGRMNLYIFAASALLLFGSLLFSLAHRAEISQSYTQLYYQEEENSIETGIIVWALTVSSQEQEEKVYRLACMDADKNQVDFHTFLLAPGEEETIQVRYPVSAADETSKVRIVLYMQGYTEKPYRWIELPVRDCAFIFSP